MSQPQSHINPHVFIPPKAARPEKTEGGIAFRLASEFEPAGDQPRAIAELIAGLKEGERNQVLLGVTGSGKTFSMAQVIAQTQRPSLILAPNKTLAAQLYGEFKSFFPDNAVEYFVSYYDYYQPKPMCPAPIPLLKRNRPSMNRLIGCAIPPPGRFWNAMM